MKYIKLFQKGEARGTGHGGLNFFFDILLYYFINVIIKTYILHIVNIVMF